MGGRVAVIVLAVVAVVAAAVFSLGGGDDQSGSGSGTDTTATQRAPSGATEVLFAVSPEKEALLKPLVERFNKDNDDNVFVRMEVKSSGEAETQIAQGRYQPQLWSPSSSFWGRLLNYESDTPYVADDNPSLVRTPLVIAMWEELAKAYGYPQKKLSYAQLADLARKGWAAVGRPEFGSFKFVHTNPDFSTSGLSAVAAQYYAAVGKREGLTEDDVRGAKARAQVRAIERSIVHYGDTTLFIADEMRKGGLGYASAVAMEETTLLDFNRDAPAGRRLVAIYPTEGTFFSDNPLIVPDAPWVSAKQRDGARMFIEFVTKELDAETAGRYGFRPADPASKPGSRISAANGVDPAQPTRVLRVPEPRVLKQIKDAWRRDRKPAQVLLVLDNSGSMGEEGRIEAAKDGLRGFLREVAAQDSVGLWKFSTEIKPVVEIAPMSTNRQRLLSAVDTIFPEDDTRLYDAALEGVSAVEAKVADDRINAVVLLSDGQDTASARTAQAVLDVLQRQGQKETSRVRLFTIAYGNEADQQVMDRFAQATGGKGFTAQTDDIAAVYRSISSFF